MGVDLPNDARIGLFPLRFVIFRQAANWWQKCNKYIYIGWRAMVDRRSARLPERKLSEAIRREISIARQ